MKFRTLKFLTFFLALMPLLGFCEQSYENIIYNGRLYPITIVTQDNYPQAYAWYQKMIQKYPQADLDKYAFVVGSGMSGWAMLPAQYVESKRVLICCPYNNLYNGFNESDEWLLLHEAGHAHNHENWSLLFKGGTDITTFSKLGIIAAIAAVAGNSYSQNHFGIQEKLKYNPFEKDDLYGHLKGSTAAAGLLVAPVVAYYAMKKAQVVAWRKIDERYADKFANKHGDLYTLKGGAEFFDRLACYEPRLRDVIYDKLFSRPYFEYYPGFIEKIKAILSHYKYNLQDLAWYLCEEHPSSSSRAQEIRKAFNRKLQKKLSEEKNEDRAILS